MSLPTLEDYNEAAQNPQLAFADPDLKRGTVRSTTLGMPRPVCGGFALTYTVSTNSGKYAVRCFHREQPNREERYAAISRKLAELKSGYFVDFQFQQNGIRIKGQGYPVVKMAWATGETLGEFVDANFRKKNALANLRSSLVNLSGFLEKHKMAHGDIQPGNLMVADNGKSLQLIDYDGMYMPELASLGANEIGHKNFQHPEREILNPWNEKNDRFSFILLDVALDALILEPRLWEKTQSDGDKFLLGANDFIAPASSPVFPQLSAIASIRDNVNRFSAICGNDYDDIPSLADFLNSSIQIVSKAQVENAPLGYISTYPVLDATNYAQCLAHVGDIVELVGTIIQVKFSRTKKGNRPYYFLNFSDWKGDSVKLAAWSDYIAKNPNIDFENLKGKTVSVIGLMQPPYEGSIYGKSYSSLSIFLDSKINIITKKERDYRLNYEKNPSRRKKSNRKPTQDGKAKTTNQEILAGVSGHSKPTSRPGGKTKPQKASPTKNSNRDILSFIASSLNTGGRTSPTRSAPPPPPAGNPGTRIVQCLSCGHWTQVPYNRTWRFYCASCHADLEYDHVHHVLRILSPGNSGVSMTASSPPNASPQSRPQKQGCLYSLASILVTLILIISGLFSLFN